MNHDDIIARNKAILDRHDRAIANTRDAIKALPKPAFKPAEIIIPTPPTAWEKFSDLVLAACIGLVSGVLLALWVLK